MKDFILTGPKHSGKTSAGKALASLCSCTFIDIDELILQRTGKSPRQLFNESSLHNGCPDLFQKAETEAIASLSDDVASVANTRQSIRVIATGGGIIDNIEAVAILKKLPAIKVYLEISAAAAWQRITAGELPPFLRTDNPQETHRSLHERRADAYRLLADIIIEVEGKTSEEIASEILIMLDKC